MDHSGRETLDVTSGANELSAVEHLWLAHRLTEALTDALRGTDSAQTGAPSENHRSRRQ
jgi:hypothetical protein